MKFILDNWILVLMALVSGTLLVMQSMRGSARGGGVGTVEAVRMINQEKAVLVDVCEPAEYAAGHAAGARNIPLGSLEGAKGLPTNKALPIILLCASGARATRAAAQLRKAGHEKAFALAGGTPAWRDANLPIEKGEKGA